MRYYLAGPIQNSDDYLSWRMDMKAFLSSIGHEALSPLSKYKGRSGDVKSEMYDLKQRGDVEKVKETMENFIIPKDIELVEDADAIIAYISTKELFGTTCEMWESYRQRKKIYVVCTLPVAEWSNWMIGITDQIFESFSELKRFLREQ
jgi:nucleoside 2-deoxyribosyltransferase